MTQDNFVITDNDTRKWLLQHDDDVNIVVANIMCMITFTISRPWLEVVLGERGTFFLA
jgi:hypothetical protein